MTLTRMILTPAQRKLLIAMYRASPTRIHHVHDLGFKLPVLKGLVRKGYAVHGKGVWTRSNDVPWKAKLTAVGRREARLLDVG